MASQKQLQLWLKKALERVDKFSAEKAEFTCEISKLNKKLSACNKQLLEAEEVVLKYQAALDPSKTSVVAPILIKDEIVPERVDNGWPASFIKLLDDWLQQRSSWNHDEWTHLINLILESEHAHLAQTETHAIGQYLESHRSLK